MNSGGVSGWVLQTESRGEKRCFEEQHDQIFDGFVVLISISLLLQLLDNAVVGIQFQVLLGCHVA